MNYSRSTDNMKPLVTIIIPTKNRKAYAVSTIEACLSLGSRAEVIVVDSSFDNALEVALKESNLLGLLRYIKTEHTFSIVETFNHSICDTQGKYVTCIGDDDFVTPAILEIAKYADAHKIDCVNFTFPATYWWPDFEHRRRGKVDAGTVSIQNYSCLVKPLDTKRALKESMSFFGGGPGRMPRVYAGLVASTLIEVVKNKYGAVFGGVSPDIFSSTLLAIESNNAVIYDYPVIVPGISGDSGSGKSSNGTHLGKLRANPYMAAFKDLVWDARIPEFYSVPTVWSFSMLKALECAGLEERVNFVSLYLKCGLYYRKYSTETLASAKRTLPQLTWWALIGFSFVALADEIVYICSAIWRRINVRLSPKSTVKYFDVKNSLEALHLVNKSLTNNEIK